MNFNVTTHFSKVDPLKMSDSSKLAEHQKRLIESVEQMFSAMESAIDLFPRWFLFYWALLSVYHLIFSHTVLSSLFSNHHSRRWSDGLKKRDTNS